MSIDKAKIVNMALTEIGAGPMFSTDDDTDLAAQIEIVWQSLTDRVIGMHDWTFCRKTFKNARQAETPDNGWKYAFDLPGGRIGMPLKIMDQAGSDPSPLRNFTYEAGVLYCNQPNTWSLVKVEVDPDAWPPEWRGAFIIALGAYLAVPVWQDRDLKADLLVEAFGVPSREGTGGLFGRLMAQDKASNPVGSPQTYDDPLLNARIGAGDHWAGRYA